MENDAMPKIKVRFIFNFCNDIEAIRNFYSDLIGMKETSYRNDEEWGWLVYDNDGLQIMWFRSGEKLPVIDGWAVQPGYESGEYAIASWSIEVPKDSFKDIIGRLKESGVKVFNTEPEWRQDSYWGFTVMDPMGNTVELFYESEGEVD